MYTHPNPTHSCCLFGVLSVHCIVSAHPGIPSFLPAFSLCLPVFFFFFFAVYTTPPRNAAGWHGASLARLLSGKTDAVKEASGQQVTNPGRRNSKRNTQVPEFFPTDSESSPVQPQTAPTSPGKVLDIHDRRRSQQSKSRCFDDTGPGGEAADLRATTRGRF
ncbi:hypothetical protein IWZ01DRAFT_512051, partial [Phyllosticta capitalensis]